MNKKEIQEEYKKFKQTLNDILDDIHKTLHPYFEKDPKICLQAITQLPLLYFMLAVEELDEEKLRYFTDRNEGLDIPGYFIRLGKVMEKMKESFPVENLKEFKEKFEKKYEEVQRQDFPEREEILNFLENE